MLGLFGKKADHPMADIKSTQKLLDEIPGDDPLKALQELTSWIESVTVESGFRPDYQFAVLRMLNDAARPHERTLTQEYFALAPPQKSMETRLWQALSEFYLQLSLASINLLRRNRSGDKGAAAMKADMALIVARGIGAVMGRLKYAAVRYAPVEHAVWEQLAELYSTAESLGNVDQPVPVYRGQNADSSVRREMAAVLMWYASCAGSVSRLDFHLAQRLAVHLRSCFTVEADCGAASVFDFDLLHPAPPMRISSARSRQPGLLFIGVKDVQEEIDACIHALENNVVPGEFNLGADYDAELVRNVLRRLAVCWSLPQQARRDARHKVNVNIRVVQGFPGVLKKAGIDGDPGSEGALWETDDISSGGFHSVLLPKNGEGLEIGSLIGAQPENVGHWGVGIVRRLSRDRQSKLHVGVQLLANKVFPVRLRELDSDVAEERSALLLDGEGQGEVSLLMPPQTFFSGRSMQMRLDGRIFLLIPVALLEMGRDFDFARYRKIEQEAV